MLVIFYLYVGDLYFLGPEKALKPTSGGEAWRDSLMVKNPSRIYTSKLHHLHFIIPSLSQSRRQTHYFRTFIKIFIQQQMKILILICHLAFFGYVPSLYLFSPSNWNTADTPSCSAEATVLQRLAITSGLKERKRKEGIWARKFGEGAGVSGGKCPPPPKKKFLKKITFFFARILWGHHCNSSFSFASLFCAVLRKRIWARTTWLERSRALFLAGLSNIGC